MANVILIWSKRILILIYLLFCGSKAFLLDGTTQPPTVGSGINDKQYNFLMEFVIQERHSRLLLETQVMKLQQQLTAVQSELSTKIDDLKQCGCANRDHITDTDNRTSILETRVENVQKSYNALATQFNQLQHENLLTVNRSIHMENEVSALKQLKGVTDLQFILGLQNMTNHLEQEIQATNSRQASLTAGVDARNQDFIALYLKLQQAETDIKANVDNIQNVTTLTNSNLVKALDAIKIVERSVQSNVSNIQSRLNAMNNRALITAMSNGGTGDVVPFPGIRAVNGIHDTSSMTNYGKFKCEKAGYYLVSVFVAVSANNGYVRIRSTRGGDLAGVSKHNVPGYQTLSATVVVHLAVAEEVYASANSGTDIWSAPDSAFTVVQITDD